MKWRFYIVAFAMVCGIIDAYAQNKGSVSIHSDPRLSMLLKTTRVIENETGSKPLGKKNRIKKSDQKTAGEKLVNEKFDVRESIPAKPKTVPLKPGKVKPVSEEESEAHRAVSGMSGGGRYNGKGFRVQIYNGASRYEALRRKSEFMRNYPGVHTYLVYASPYYKLKVGDFRRREDAIGMYHEANGTYSPCMIVPDMVLIK